jgi:hypothetical protein
LAGWVYAHLLVWLSTLYWLPWAKRNIFLLPLVWFSCWYVSMLCGCTQRSLEQSLERCAGRPPQTWPVPRLDN